MLRDVPSGLNYRTITTGVRTTIIHYNKWWCFCVRVRDGSGVFWLTINAQLLQYSIILRAFFWGGGVGSSAPISLCYSFKAGTQTNQCSKKWPWLVKKFRKNVYVYNYISHKNMDLLLKKKCIINHENKLLLDIIAHSRQRPKYNEYQHYSDNTSMRKWIIFRSLVWML